MSLYAPCRFTAGARCTDRITSIPVTVIQPLSEFHQRTGQRLYLTRSPSGRERRLQERNLKPAN